MTAFLSALGSGISAKKILEYLMKKSPELAPKITKSLGAGISAEKILSFFSKDKNFEKLKSSIQQEYSTENNANPLVQAENIRGQNLGQDPASALQRNIPGILGGTVMAAAAPLVSRGVQAALSRALPRSLAPVPVSLIGENNDGILAPSSPQQSSQSQTVTPSIEQKLQNTSQQPPSLGNANIQQPINVQQPKLISNPKDYLEKLGVLDRVKSLLKAGNTPEGAATALSIKRSGEAKVDPELLKNIEAYAQEALREEAMQPEGSQPLNQIKTGKIPTEQQKISPEIEKPKSSKKLDLPFSEKSYRKLLSTPENDFAGKVGDFIEDEEMRKILGPVLDIDVALVPKKHFKNNGGSGSYVSKDYGKVILLNKDDVLFGDPKEIYNTILHESTHALQDHKGRIDYLKKGDHYKGKVGIDEEATKQYKENVHENSANKLADYGLKRHIAKNSVVSSPQGVGEVKEVRNGQAIVDVNGKLHKVKEEDLEPSLYSDDEIADAYDNIMAKIPESERSGFISWAGYDEDRNVLGFIPRGGKYEELHNITPKEAKMIKEGKGVARTTGANREGLWVSGEDTRGGVISQIIHDRRKKNKTEDEKQLKLGLELPKKEKQDKGMKPLFDEMAHARNLSREREKRKKDEAKKRKKQA